MSTEKLVPKLRFNGFDDEWKSYKIGDISKTYSGGTPSTSKKEYYEGDIPFIKSGEINNDVTEQHITEDAINNSSAKRVQKGDLLLALYGATSGEVAISKINGAINQAVLKIDNDMDNYFQYNYFLKYKEQITQKYLQGGQGNLSANIIKKLEFNFPELNEQQKISKFLLLIDTKIELLEKKYETYVDFKKYLMQQIFAQKLRFDFKGTWNIDKIGNNCEVFGRIGFRGYTVDDLVNKGEGALTIGGKHISKNFQLDLTDPEYLSLEKYEESPEIKIYNGDVLLVKTASVGKVCYIENLNEKATINPQLVVFKNIKLNNKFFYYYLTSSLFQKDLHRIKSTTGIPTITQKELLNLNIIYPSLEEQEKIVSLFSTVDKKIDIIDKTLKDIEIFKKGLLQQMFV